MSEIKDGGPAFPVSTRLDDTANEYGHQDGHTTWQYGGLTMRDYFAAQAMQSQLITHTDQNTRNIVEWSYQVADEMLACRARSQP
ncbi:hypothetical protein [Paraburkholderia graminis]|uniref:hypothetical protein n=1 Tax=Paraburkholderia graminis TaxID=60548 RepID=UPI0038BB655C